MPVFARWLIAPLAFLTMPTLLSALYRTVVSEKSVAAKIGWGLGLLLITLFFLEIGSAALTISKVKTRATIMQPDSYDPSALTTVYLFTPGMLGTTQTILDIFKPFLSFKGWMVGIDIKPGSPYKASDTAQIIEALISQIEKKVNARTRIIAVAQGTGVVAITTWLRLYEYRKLEHLVIDSGPGSYTDIKKPSLILRRIAGNYPAGWVSRLVFWFWKVCQPGVSGPAVTPYIKKVHKRHLRQFGLQAVLAQLGVLSSYLVCYREFENRIRKLTYVTASDKGLADPYVNIATAQQNWASTVRSSQFQTKAMSKWPAGTHCNTGLYRSYAAFVATL